MKLFLSSVEIQISRGFTTNTFNRKLRNGRLLQFFPNLLNNTKTERKKKE